MKSPLTAEPRPNPDVEFFQQLADGAPVLIWMSGKDMGCHYFNRAWLDYRGRSMEQEFGNGWAKGVHPDDLERCVQHYVVSFEKRVPFAMSYRLQHQSGEFRWILDRGAPHFGGDGEFLGYCGGCAETPVDSSVSRIAELRKALRQMQNVAEHLIAAEANALQRYSSQTETLQATTRRLVLEHHARQHAAAQIGKLATDMLTYDRIANGACV